MNAPWCLQMKCGGDLPGVGKLVSSDADTKSGRLKRVRVHRSAVQRYQNHAEREYFLGNRNTAANYVIAYLWFSHVIWPEFMWVLTRFVKQESCQLRISLRISELPNVISVGATRDAVIHEISRDSCQLCATTGHILKSEIWQSIFIWH